MKKHLFLLGFGLLVLATGWFASADTTHGAFHLMRVWGVMAGANGDADIQYVELRMTDPGQNFVASHDICFFDASGAPYARFTFPGNVGSGADEASILVATAEFDAAWPGTPDFTFGPANTTAIAGGADTSHPVRGPSGKVVFGSDSATMASLMCQGSFAPIDSVAYGTGYTGTVDHPPALGSDLPTAGTSGAKFVGQLCYPGSFGSPCTMVPQRDNERDYNVVDNNNPGSNNPRNNAGVTGDIASPPPDSDGDGVPDASDNCPAWPNPGQGLPVWSVPAGDSDCDGFPETVTAAPRGREDFIGTDPADNCPDNTGDHAWPPDINNSGLASLSDVIAFGPTFNQVGPDPPYNSRMDLNAAPQPDGLVSLSDIIAMGPFFNKACTS